MLSTLMDCSIVGTVWSAAFVLSVDADARSNFEGAVGNALAFGLLGALGGVTVGFASSAITRRIVRECLRLHSDDLISFRMRLTPRIYWLAATGVVIPSGFAATDSRALVWGAFSALALGLLLVASSEIVRRTCDEAARHGAVPNDRAKLLASRTEATARLARRRQVLRALGLLAAAAGGIVILANVWILTTSS
ncbi:MAG TPA: hypothetical protein VNA14_02210 [Mycobacteriales bacterium]|nr:hypothetical protein [Mycobacteriales bacterium]